ncbi:hypothetical protein BJ741DRAFT_652965 [Chytriomyces cf. hyalinus JEL632]|nr:hypothetical protein BJ741DRAFT_652965 [Chytriomyces cf. hyalinus JEL632]
MDSATTLQLIEWVCGKEEDIPMTASQADAATQGRVLRARVGMVKDSIVLRVPAHVLLSASAAWRVKSDLGRVLVQVFGASHDTSQAEVTETESSQSAPPLMDHYDPHLALCLLLMYARINDTPYKPYLLSLPASFSNLLCLELDNPQALTRIQGTPVMGVVEDERSQLQLVLDHVLMPVAKMYPGVISRSVTSASNEEVRQSLWRDLMWAHASIASRAFKFSLDKEQSEVFCVPFLDLANHSDTPNLIVKGVDVESKCLIVKATRDIEPGEELTIAYHDQAPNSFLLTHYGFAMEGNPEEKVEVYFADPNESEEVDEATAALTERKDALLQAASEILNLNLGREQEFGPLPVSSTGNEAALHDASQSPSSQSGVSLSMIFSLRILVANEADLEHVTSENVGSRIQSPLSRENEANVYQMISLMADALLGMYPTTLEQDLERQKELNQGQAGDDDSDRYVVVYLIGQKCILRKVLEFCEKNQNMWTMVWKAV